MATPPTLDCDRARALVSLAIDSEASELEHGALAAHVRTCAECAHFQHEARELATAVRAAPHEAASRSMWVAREPRRRGPGWAAAVAMSLALAGGMGAAVAGLGHGSRPAHTQPTLLVAQRPPFSLAHELLVFRTEHGRPAPAPARWPRIRLLL